MEGSDSEGPELYKVNGVGYLLKSEKHLLAGQINE